MNALQLHLASPPPPKPRRSKGKIILMAILLLIALAVLPPLKTFNGFRNRIEAAMSAAVGRKITVKDVSIRLLPRPGFELSDFAIADDPALSGEPMLRADEVSATLRLASLWRGRIEVANLDLNKPSLNLVRAPDGTWNVEQILAHTYQVPLAPTAKVQAEARPRFPYIDASGGRINIKVGPEKKVWALSDADFALWLASEDQWQMRLKGQPIRTDADLGDTGTLKIEGSFSRSISTRQTPLKFDISLEGAQLGQLSQLIYGRERGWRGALDADAQLSGSPAALNISASLTIKDFRRYDIAAPDLLDFKIACGVAYAGAISESERGVLRGSCTLPSGRGLLNLTGYLVPATRDADATLVAAAFPASTVMQFARHMKRGMADDLAAQGNVNGSIRFVHGNMTANVAAEPTKGFAVSTLTADALLTSRNLKPPLSLGTLIFNFEQPITNSGSRTKQKGETQLALLPANVGLGGGSPVVVSGTFKHENYELRVKGETDIARFRNFASALGLPITSIGGEGRARVDVAFTGNWKGFAAPVMLGSVRPLLPTTVAKKRP